MCAHMCTGRKRAWPWAMAWAKPAATHEADEVIERAIAGEVEDEDEDEDEIVKGGGRRRSLLESM